MNSFEEFRDMWMGETSHLRIKNPYLYVVVYPDKLEWDFHIEKQTQTTCLMTSGGVTGAGTGHKQVLCRRSEVNKVLKDSSETHAMIVTVGVVFDMTTNRTPIQRFWSFAESGEYCKAHIIAKPDYAAYLHHQHIELNVDMWKTYGCPDIYERWDDFTRSSANYHDDYTPPWIVPEGLPVIHNFTESDRVFKAFAYHMDNRETLQKENWEIIHANKEGWRNHVTVDDPYFRVLMTRMHVKFYAENTENLGRIPEGKFDLIFTPTAGYSGEVLADKLDFKGEIVFYDYCSENIEIKQNIVNMNMDFEDLQTYAKVSEHNIVFSSNLPKHYEVSDELKQRVRTFGSFEECRELQQKMSDNYDVDYMLIDMIQPDYEKIIEKVKGKKVFFNLSNIFSYHVSHVCYTLDELIDSLERLTNVLSENSEHYYIKGKRPGKQDIMENV